jgi:type I restriction enzyme S subunit
MKKRTVQLGDVCTIVGGGTPSRDRPDYYGGSIPWMTVKDFGDGFSIRSTQERITQAGLDNSASRLIPSGNVIIGTRMSVGKATLNQIDLAINQDLKALLCRSELMPEYLTFFLASAAPGLEAKATGATVKGITIDEIQELDIPLPSLSDQRRIAAMLEQADQLRRTRRYALELSDFFLPAAFLEMFGEPVDNPNRYPISTLEDELSAIESGFSPVCEGPRTSVDQWAVLGLGAVSSGVFKPEENKVLPLNIPPRPDIEVRNEDVLVTRKNTYDLVAACALVRDPPPRLLLPDTIFRFVIRDRDRLAPAYLWALLTSAHFRKRVQSLAGGSAGSMPNISKEKFMSMKLPIPPLTLQQRFADLVRGHERLRATQRESLRQAEHLFQSLLHRAFEEWG